MNQKPDFKKKSKKLGHATHNEIVVEREMFLEWIEFIGYVLHDVDLSLNDADIEIVEILEEFEKEFHQIADKQKVEWRHVWDDKDSGDSEQLEE